MLSPGSSGLAPSTTGQEIGVVILSSMMTTGATKAGGAVPDDVFVTTKT